MLIIHFLSQSPAAICKAPPTHCVIEVTISHLSTAASFTNATDMLNIERHISFILGTMAVISLISLAVYQDIEECIWSQSLNAPGLLNGRTQGLLCAIM